MIIYHAKFDIWLLATMVITLFVGLITSFELLQTNLAAGATIFIAIVLVALAILTFGIPCEYYLDEEHLRIRSGLRLQSFHYRDILAAERARTLLPQPAWSLRRVDIVLDSGIRQISPEKREDFLNEINQRMEAMRKPEEA